MSAIEADGAARALEEKRAYLADLRTELERELAQFKARALDAAEAATHEENRAEGDKDMRATEASYVAHGQARQARELEAALGRLAGVTLRAFGDGSAIESSALVTLEEGGRRQTFFLLPVAGGRDLVGPTGRTRTLATVSPLGRALLGLCEGDEAEVSTPQGVRTHAVVRVR